MFKKLGKRKIWLLIGGFLVVLAILYFTNFKGISSQSSEQKLTDKVKTLMLEKKVEPSPVPFQELTIEYLRQRAYQSQLGELQPYQKNSDYNSYLTSYDSDGLSINGLLTIPLGEPPEGGWPAVVFVHGYIPPIRYSTTSQYQSYVDYLAKNGLAVFKIDLRGHGQSEGESSGAYFSSDYIIDTLNAKSALVNLDVINPSKIGLWGHSMAGNVVLRAMVVDPEVLASVIWAGAVFTYQDMQDFGINDNSYIRPSDDSPSRQERTRLFEVRGNPDPNNEFWAKVIPTNFLSEIKGAIQLHHAINDEVVSIEYSRNLSRLLDLGGVSYQLFEYQTGGHNLEGSRFNQAMQRTVDFLTNSY